MAEIRGILLNGWMGLLKEKYAQEQIERFRMELSPADRALASKILLDSNWYPLDTLYAFHDLTRLLAGNGKQILPVAIGRSMAERAYGGVYRRLPSKDPAKQVEKLSYISEFFFVIAGAWRPKSTAKEPAISGIHTRSAEPMLGLFA